MATTVSNLTIDAQTGSDNTVYASWSAPTTTTTSTSSSSSSSSSSSISVGSYVTINSGATWYNGSSIPSWVMSLVWVVYCITSTNTSRIVLNKDVSGTYSIMSPINKSYLTVTDSSGNALSSSSSSSTTTTTTTTVSHLDYYQVKWYYATGDGIWFAGSDSQVEETNATYSFPSNATKVKVKVKPVSDTYTSNSSTVSYWTGSYSSATYTVSDYPPEDLSGAPTVEVDGYVITAYYDNISDARTDKVCFQIYNDTSKVSTATVTVTACKASTTYTGTAGGSYRVRAKPINITSDSTDLSGNWTDFSTAVDVIPAAPGSITKCVAQSSTSVYLVWDSVDTADTYEIVYATDSSYLESSNASTSITGIEYAYYIITGLEEGNEYFFMVRAVNDQGESSWSDVASVVLGASPASPTTWSSSTTVMVGETVTFYWVNNSEDGSHARMSNLHLDISGSTTLATITSTDLTYSVYDYLSSSGYELIEITHDADDDTDEDIYSLTIDTSVYEEGVTISWAVQTMTITEEYGDWSAYRTVNIYAEPSLAIDITDSDGTSIDEIESFPFYITASAGPDTQTPIGYHASIVANSSYEAYDSTGEEIIISAGDEVYSKYYDTSSDLLLELTPGSVDLDPSSTYTLTVTVSMNTGLTKSSSLDFSVVWTDEEYSTNAEVSIDTNSYLAYIQPFCEDSDGNRVTDVYLSVYRREFDGTFTKIASDLDGDMNSAVVDPHPALNYARYRIIATDKNTGSISYSDLPGYPVNGKSIVIQWDEEWSDFDIVDTIEDEFMDQPWTGSMLLLPYDIDVSDSYSPDVSKVKYIGRSYPVTYYGTQIDSTSSWSVDIETDDADTLYALRRLAIWMGDVYVREPSGSGYWAQVNVSISQTHCELVTPISLEITRVEGGA